MAISTIYTDRLMLIPFTLPTAEALLKGQTDVLKEAGLQPTPYWPDQEALDTLPKIINNLKLVPEPSGFESWMVVLKEGMTVIGDAGFKGAPNSAGEADLGYAIIAQEQRKGYGVEVARALAEWALQQPTVSAVTAKCLIGNTASARILEKLGMKETGRDEEMINWRMTSLITN